MIIPFLQKNIPGQFVVSEYTPSSVIQRHHSDIWVHPVILEGAANLVALDLWLAKGEFDEITAAEESVAGGVNPMEITNPEPARFLGYCLAALKDRATAVVAAIGYGSANTMLDKINDASVEGLHSFFRGELVEMEKFYPQVVKRVREALGRPGMLDNFYSSRSDATSGSGTVLLKSFWHGEGSPSTIPAPDFTLSPALTIEEGFRLMASPPVGRMRASSFSSVSADLVNLATALESVFKRLASGAE